jgi:hypothetical protein
MVGAPNPAAASPKVVKTVHCRFRLLNCIFSDELGALADRSEDVDRAALDSGLVGDNSIYWKLVEERFNAGFPVGSIDGPLWANKVHFHHPLIANYDPQVHPEDHGTFSSSDLRSMWKELQKEYDRVFTNFKKSGNHNSSFTKAAMAVYRKETGDDDDNSNASFDSADADDCFGQEEDDFCCFTNSIVIVYLRLWLNEKPGLTNFVSRHLPAELQIDSMTGAAASLLRLQSKSIKRKSTDDAVSLAAAISELASAKKRDDGKKDMHNSISSFMASEKIKVEVETQMEKINLLRAQIAALKERLNECVDEAMKPKYERGLAELGNKLDELLLSQFSY